MRVFGFGPCQSPRTNESSNKTRKSTLTRRQTSLSGRRAAGAPNSVCRTDSGSPGFQRFPGLEFRHEQALDLGRALAVGAQDVGRLAVVVGLVHARVERALLGFQRFDLLRQGFELAGFLVGELGALFTRRNP